eukprot:m.240334 g.240334  ORF g.240334 m.240334 type:complete len:122 (+) comp33764_c7_seq6:266-631(+)
MDNTLDASDDEAPGAYWEIGPDLEPTDIARKMNTYSFRSNGKAPPEQFATQPGLTRWTYRGRRDPSKSVSFSDGGGGGGGGVDNVAVVTANVVGRRSIFRWCLRFRTVTSSRSFCFSGDVG